MKAKEMIRLLSSYLAPDGVKPAAGDAAKPAAGDAAAPADAAKPAAAGDAAKPAKK
jgi:hypothetical protein